MKEKIPVPYEVELIQEINALMEEVPSNYYLNNRKLVEAIIEYKKQKAEALANGEPMVRIPEYIGSCFLLIAQNTIKRTNFYNYPFKEEMVGDAVENCCMYFHNFNPEKSQNAFGYLGRIIWFAFLRRIQKEKKYLYTKQKLFEHSIVFNEMFGVDDHDISDEMQVMFDPNTDKMNDFTTTYENWMAVKKQKKEKREDLRESDSNESHFEIEDFNHDTEDESTDSRDDSQLV